MAQLANKSQEVRFDPEESLFAEVHQVHLVDHDREGADAHQPGDARVAAGLRQHAFARIHQQNGQAGAGGAGRHIARILLVAGRIGHDELAARGGEVAVGDVDGDALLALDAEAVGDQGEIYAAGGGSARRDRADGGHLILVDSMGIVQEAPDERGFAIVDAAGGQKTEQLAPVDQK